MGMNQAIDQDWALVVGIQYYPGLAASLSGSEALRGPVNDANEFAKWLTAPKPQGAGVPSQNVHRIVQQNLPSPTGSSSPPNPADAEFAQPNQGDLFNVLSSFNSIAMSHRTAMLGQKIGRRLYMYLAGHGIEPGLSLPGYSAGPALLLANAVPYDFSRHILAKQLANWFYYAAYFDEVLLFMDCCRDNTWKTFASSLQLGQVNATQLGKYFYAFGTKWDRRSRELDFDGQVHGIFTKALLEGLGGAASDPVTGDVTVGSLRDYIPQIMDELVGSRLAGLPPQKPDFEPVSEDFVVCSVPPKLYSVKFALPHGAIGRKLGVRAGPKMRLLKEATPNGPEFALELPRGAYLGQFSDQAGTIWTAPFEVPLKSPVVFSSS